MLYTHNTYLYLSISLSLYIYAHVYIYIYIYIYTCSYIHSTTRILHHYPSRRSDVLRCAYHGDISIRAAEIMHYSISHVQALATCSTISIEHISRSSSSSIQHISRSSSSIMLMSASLQFAACKWRACAVCSCG